MPAAVRLDVFAGLFVSSATRPTPRSWRIAAPTRVVAVVDRQAELDVGVDGVEALVLQLVGPQLVGDADAPALVAAQVDDDAGAGRRRSSASPRAAAGRSRSAASANTSPVRHSLWTRTRTGSVAGGDVAAHERQVGHVVAVGLERQAAERAELGRQAGVGDAVDDRAVSHRRSVAVGVAITRSKRTSSPSVDTEVNRPRRSTSIVGAPGPRNSPSGVVAAEHGRGEVDDVAVDEAGGVERVGDGRPALDEQLQRRRGRRARRAPSPRSPDRSRHGCTLAPGGRPAEHDAQRVGAGDVADGQRRVVGAHGAGADEDRLALGAQAVGVGAGLGAGDPLARAVGRRRARRRRWRPA